MHSFTATKGPDITSAVEHESPLDGKEQQTRSCGCKWLVTIPRQAPDVKPQFAFSLCLAFSDETADARSVWDLDWCGASRMTTYIRRSSTLITSSLVEPSLLNLQATTQFPSIQSMTNVQQSSDYPLSSVVVGNLARLTPVDLMPERYSRHMRILTKLKQIRQVQVSRGADNNHSYVIDVFTTSQSITRIPTSLKSIDSALTKAKGQQSTTLFSSPDVHVEKQFTDVVKLRDELYDACHTGPHLYMSCRFCSEVTRYLLFGAVLPGALLTWMLPQHQRIKAVQRFIESLLSLATSCPVIDSEACTCQEKLPRQLYKFLFETST